MAPTEISPTQSLGRQPDLERIVVKFGDGETGTVNADAVTDVAVVENGFGIAYGD